MKNNTIVTWTDADNEMLKTCKAGIENCQKQADGIAQRVAGYLFTVDKHSLYEIEDFTGVGKWAEHHFGIKKSTTSEAIKVFKRFGSEKDGNAKIIDKYSEYAFTALVALAPYSDETIEREKINPQMTRSAIRDIVQAMKLRAEICEKKPDEVSALEMDDSLPSLDWLNSFKEKRLALQEKQKEENSSPDEPQEENENSSADEPQEENVSRETIYLSDYFDESGKLKGKLKVDDVRKEIYYKITVAIAQKKDIELLHPSWTRE